MRVVGISVLAVLFWSLGEVGFAVAMEEDSERDDTGPSSLPLPEIVVSDTDSVPFSMVSSQSLPGQRSSDPIEQLGQRLRAISPQLEASPNRPTVKVKRSFSDSLLNFRKKPIRESPSFVKKSGRSLRGEKGGFYFQTYENVAMFDPVTDQALFDLINLSYKFADGRKSEGFWKTFVWQLERWIVERSWYGEAKGLVPMVESPERIELIELTSVPRLSVFLTRLVAIVKTFDEYWVIHGESTNATMLRYLKSAISSNIRGVVGQVAVFGGRDDAQVVSNTARVVYSLLSVAGKYYDELIKHQPVDGQELWLEQVKVLSKISDSMGTLVKLARTPSDLQLAMAVMNMATRWLDRESPFDTFQPIGLTGLDHLQKVLQVSFDMGHVEQAEAGKPPVFAGIPVMLEQLKLSSAHYQHLLKYVWLLLRGDIRGLMLVDSAWMSDHVAYRGIDIHTLPDGQPAALTSEVIRGSIFHRAQRTMGEIEALPRLNTQLFELLFSPAGETLDAFYLLCMLREIGDMCVDHKDKPCLDSQLAFRNFMANSDVVRGLGELTNSLAQISGDVQSQRSYAERLAGFHSARERLQRIVTPYGDECIRPVDAVGALMAAMHRNSTPVLPTAAGMESKQ